MKTLALKIAIGVISAVALILLAVSLSLWKPWEKPMGEIASTAANSSDDLPKSVVKISTDADLDFFVFEEKMTYEETLRSCSQVKNKDGTQTYPIRAITRQEGVDLFETLYHNMKGRVVTDTAKPLYWTGARFDLLSDNPYILRLPDNQTRSSLEFLAEDWCPESLNYEEKIAQALAKVRELEQEIKSPIITPQAIHVTLKYNPKREHTCLHLFDSDVGLKDPANATRLAGACETRLPSWSTQDTTKAEPDRTYFFPIIGKKNVTFFNAVAHCKLKSGYTLAGLATTNLKVLSQTAELVAKEHASAVWVGGFFNLSSLNPYLLHWTDGNVTDSRKTPLGVWCKGITEEIKALHDKYFKLTDEAHTYIVPIVRLRKNPACLSLYTEDLLWPDRSIFPPLCVSNRARIFFTMDGKLTVLNSPSFYASLFDNNHRAFDEMQTYPSRGKRQGGTAIVHAHGRSSHIVTSIRDTVPYSYAKEFCKLVRSRNETTQGDMLTDNVLNSQFIEEYKLSFKVYQSWLTFIQGYDEINNRIALSTAGYFDFRPSSDSVDYTKLIWDTVNGTRKATHTNLRFGWCKNVDPVNDVKKVYKEFENWYHHSDGKLTTGPNRVYVGVEAVPGAPCLRLVYDELYWPGAYSWVPACEKLKLQNVNYKRIKAREESEMDYEE